MRSSLRGAARRTWLVPLVLLAFVACDSRARVVLYSPHGRDLLQVIEEAFEQSHPEIDLRWLDMGSQEVYDRIRSERANPQADVWFGGPATIFSRAAAEGLLRPSEPSWLSTVPEEGRQPEHLYASLYRTPTLIVYNKAAVSAEEAPCDWDDLLAEQWRRKILIRDPLASGTMRTIFGFILGRSLTETGDTEDGFDWLRRLDAQTKEYVHSPALLHEKIIRQEGLVTVWEMTDILGQIARGAPLAYCFPESGTPVIEDSIGLVANSPNVEEGELFMEWVGQIEAVTLAAEKAFRLPARSDLDPSALPPWIENVQETLTSAPVDWSVLEENGARWMGEWDRQIRGRGK